AHVVAEMLVQNELEMRLGLLGPVLFEQSEAELAADFGCVTSGERLAKRRLRLRPAGEITVSGAQVGLDDRVGKGVLGQAGRPLGEQPFVLVTGRYGDRLSDGFGVVGVLLQELEEAGDVLGFRLFPLLEAKEAVLLARRALFQDALAAERRHRDEEDDEV